MRFWMIFALVASFAATAPGYAQEAPLLAGSGGVPVPKKSRYVQPEYPAEAIQKGLRGIVILELVIDAAGKVASAEVVRSVPPFDDAALKAARQWEYEVMTGELRKAKRGVRRTHSKCFPGTASTRQGAARPRHALAVVECRGDELRTARAGSNTCRLAVASWALAAHP